MAKDETKSEVKGAPKRYLVYRVTDANGVNISNDVKLEVFAASAKTGLVLAALDANEGAKNMGLPKG